MRYLTVYEELCAKPTHSNKQMATYYNCKWSSPPEYSPGNLILLLRQNIKTTHPSNKLDYCYLGLFEILEKHGRSAYLLKPYNSPSTIDSCLTPPTPHVRIQHNHTPLVIEKVLDIRKLGWHFKYFIKWEDLNSTENSWVLLSDVPCSSNELLETYHCRHPKSVHPPRFTFTQAQTQPSTGTLQEHQDSPWTILTPPSKALSSLPFTSPPHNHWMSTWQPPAQTTLRSGRISRPRTLEGG